LLATKTPRHKGIHHKLTRIDTSFLDADLHGNYIICLLGVGQFGLGLSSGLVLA